MKKLSLLIAIVLFAFCLQAQTVRLNPPTQKGGMPLMQALKERQSIREFSETPLTLQQMSDVLWAAVGVNRPNKENRRTSPTARNSQEIEVYMFTEKGVFFYDAIKHELQLIKTGDFRVEAAKQPFAQAAPVILVYVANYNKFGNMSEADMALYGATDCGFASQNVYLYCASEGLGTVVVGMIDREALSQFLGLKNGKVILSQPVGNKK